MTAPITTSATNAAAATHPSATVVAKVPQAPVWQRILLRALLPEVTLGMLLFTVARQQLRTRLDRRWPGDDRERGDVVQWVILAAIGAAIAITVGTIVYNKVKSKANSITTDTPTAGQ